MDRFDAAGLPEFFVTDIKIEVLPGNCLCTTFIHPVDGEVARIVAPFSCWLEMRLKFAAFQRAHVEPAGVGQVLLGMPH